MLFKILILIHLILIQSTVEGGRRRKRNAPCVCGRELVTEKIIGGLESKPHLYPWEVILTDNDFGDALCGAAIINSRYLVTAAHCFNDWRNKKIKIYIGVHNSLQDLNKENEFEFEEIKFFDKNFENYLEENFTDIALIKLKSHLNFTNQYIKPICLFSKPIRIKSSSVAIIAGWGRTADDSLTSNVLRHITIPIIKLNDCRKKYRPYHLEIKNNQICGGTQDADTSDGDSGSPLMMRRNGRIVLIGITSFGDIVDKRNKPKQGTRLPGVFLNVQKFSKWILANAFNEPLEPCQYFVDADQRFV